MVKIQKIVASHARAAFRWVWAEPLVVPGNMRLRDNAGIPGIIALQGCTCREFNSAGERDIVSLNRKLITRHNTDVRVNMLLASIAQEIF